MGAVPLAPSRSWEASQTLLPHAPPPPSYQCCNTALSRPVCKQRCTLPSCNGILSSAIRSAIPSVWINKMYQLMNSYVWMVHTTWKVQGCSRLQICEMRRMAWTFVNTVNTVPTHLSANIKSNVQRHPILDGLSLRFLNWFVSLYISVYFKRVMYGNG